MCCQAPRPCRGDFDTELLDLLSRETHDLFLVMVVLCRAMAVLVVVAMLVYARLAGSILMLVGVSFVFRLSCLG
jgi:hypothetical protein